MSNPRTDLPEGLEQELRKLRVQVCLPKVAESLVENFLTPEQQAEYIEEEIAPGNLITWLSEYCQISPETALLQLAENANLINRARREFLLKKLSSSFAL